MKKLQPTPLNPPEPASNANLNPVHHRHEKSAHPSPLFASFRRRTGRDVPCQLLCLPPRRLRATTGTLLTVTAKARNARRNTLLLRSFSQNGVRRGQLLSGLLPFTIRPTMGSVTGPITIPTATTVVITTVVVIIMGGHSRRWSLPRRPRWLPPPRRRASLGVVVVAAT